MTVGIKPAGNNYRNRFILNHSVTQDLQMRLTIIWEAAKLLNSFKDIDCRIDMGIGLTMILSDLPDYLRDNYRIYVGKLI